MIFVNDRKMDSSNYFYSLKFLHKNRIITSSFGRNQKLFGGIFLNPEEKQVKQKQQSMCVNKVAKSKTKTTISLCERSSGRTKEKQLNVCKRKTKHHHHSRKVDLQKKQPAGLPPPPWGIGFGF